MVLENIELKITMISKDKHQYEFNMIVSKSETIENIHQKALNQIIQKGWDNYEYKVLNIEKIIKSDKKL